MISLFFCLASLTCIIEAVGTLPKGSSRVRGATRRRAQKEVPVKIPKETGAATKEPKATKLPGATKVPKAQPADKNPGTFGIDPEQQSLGLETWEPTDSSSPTMTQVDYDPWVAEFGEDELLDDGAIWGGTSVPGGATGALIAGAGFIGTFMLSIHLIGMFRDKYNEEPSQRAENDQGGLEDKSCPSDEDSEAEEYEFRKITGFLSPGLDKPKREEAKVFKISSLEEGRAVEEHYVWQYDNDIRIEDIHLKRQTSSQDTQKRGFSYAAQIDMTGDVHAQRQTDSQGQRRRRESRAAKIDMTDNKQMRQLSHDMADNDQPQIQTSWQDRRKCRVSSHAAQVDMTGNVRMLESFLPCTQDDEYDPAWLSSDSEEDEDSERLSEVSFATTKAANPPVHTSSRRRMADVEL